MRFAGGVEDRAQARGRGACPHAAIGAEVAHLGEHGAVRPHRQAIHAFVARAGAADVAVFAYFLNGLALI